MDRDREGAALLARGREVLEAEGQAILDLRARIDGAFVAATRLILACTGRVVITGMGKAGFIARKISATLASTGTPSLYLHPAEAVHGDLGRVVKDDLVLALSNSGETEEILRLLNPVRQIGARIVAITRSAGSSLGSAADVVLELGPIEEACPIGLAPTASTTAMLALGDALAMAVLSRRAFGPEEFARYHPAGSLGRMLMRVGEVMRRGPANPIVAQGTPLATVMAVMTETPGRPGAAVVVDGEGRLAGLFTDGDLRRLAGRGQVDFEIPVDQVMNATPKTLGPQRLVGEAVALLRENQVDQVPVVDDDRRPVGLLDVQDLLAVRVLL